jgi:hypothetical protein
MTLLPVSGTLTGLNGENEENHKISELCLLTVNTNFQPRNNHNTAMPIRLMSASAAEVCPSISHRGEPNLNAGQSTWDLLLTK